DEIVARREISPGRLRALLLLGALPTTALFYLATVVTAATANPEVYIPRAEAAAIQWLDDNAVERERGAVVFARIETGNIVPAFSGLRPYVGHGPETLDYERKELEAIAYFDDTLTADERAALIAVSTADYVLFGVADSPPGWADDELEMIYEVDGVQLYAVPGGRR
ncbi:MAG: hypothetical protein AAF125_14730, partial [Chloroflexota bacterium]